VSDVPKTPIVIEKVSVVP